MIQNEKGESIPTRLTTGWRVCIHYRKLNVVTRNDHFPLPFMDQVLKRVSRHPYYCFLDGYSSYFQLEIALEDQEKTTFTCPFGTYAYKRKPFGLCYVLTTFQRCMLSIVLGHVVSRKGIEVDKANIELIVNLPPPTNVKEDAKFKWDENCQNWFEELKRLLTSTPIEETKLGLLFKQRDEWKPYVIYYASKTLNEAQKNYTTIKKNCLQLSLY
ncbi:hypothetical protein AAG906_010394 [Vitis piasezkii]